MTITSAERTALLSLVRARDKVIKASIKVRAAEMLADFERDITKFYGSDHDDIWDNIRKGVATITDEANEKITALCKRVGVSRGGVPTIYVSWYGYGRENLEEKREELRKRAKAEITLKTKEAEARHAKTINETEERVLSASFTTDEGNALFKSLPTITQLMPDINFRVVSSISKILARSNHLTLVSPEDDEESE